MPESKPDKKVDLKPLTVEELVELAKELGLPGDKLNELADALKVVKSSSPESIKRRYNRWKKRHSNWQEMSLKNAIEKFLGKNYEIKGARSGKIIYKDLVNQIEIVHDYLNNYFKIRDLTIENIEFSYLTKDGLNPVPEYKSHSDTEVVKMIKGGRIPSELLDLYRRGTHFTWGGNR